MSTTVDEGLAFIFIYYGSCFTRIATAILHHTKKNLIRVDRTGRIEGMLKLK